MSTNKIKISDLDFDQIKANLKTFLTAQSEYTDYDFEGSGLSVLLDVLAYNTHYNAMYTNLAFNEMFLDSASKRNSVVSIANNFGYLPVSRRASKATIKLVVPKGTSTNTVLVLPKYSAFSSTINGIKYNFYNIIEASGGIVGTNYEIPNIQLVEGTPVTEKFTIFQSSDSMMMLNNTNIDTSTLKVTVQDVAESFTSTMYSFVDNMVGLTNTSKVYFVKETEDSKYKVYFGKNNLGYEPGIGSVVTVEYMITSGSAANGIKLFSYNGATLASGIGTPIITLPTTSIGGKDIESNDEIKYNVSHKFRTQDRAVTADDYVSIIKSDYGAVDAITCWGGETANPPVYGKVYIAIKPTNAYVLTATQRTYIRDTILKPKAVIGIYPELVDPEYIIVQLNVKFYYNANMTNKSSTQLETLVRESIADYNTSNLLKFGGALRQSRLSRSIDDTDVSITNNVVSMHLRKIVPVVYNTAAQYIVAFNNPIPQAGFGEEYVMSTGFYITSDEDRKTYYIDDDGLGSLRLFYYSEITRGKVVIDAQFGSVDYISGLITIYSAFITGLVGSDLEFIVTHRNENVLAKYNQIVDIRPTYVNVTAIQENTQM